MLLPNKFKDEISSRFYDKEITILTKQETIEPDGGVIRNDEAAKGTFLGNVRFSVNAELQSEIGLSVDADIIITCDSEIEIALGDRVAYLGKKYKVNNLLPSDSHLTITGKECQ